VIIDVTVVAGNTNLLDAHKRKVVCYNAEEIKRCLTCKAGCKQVVVGALVVSWRGCVAQA